MYFIIPETNPSAVAVEEDTYTTEIVVGVLVGVLVLVIAIVVIVVFIRLVKTHWIIDWIRLCNCAQNKRQYSFIWPEHVLYKRNVIFYLKNIIKKKPPKNNWSVNWWPPSLVILICVFCRYIQRSDSRIIAHQKKWYDCLTKWFRCSEKLCIRVK